jgi:hypothetical protein
LYALGLLYILPGMIGRDPWKDDAASFGIMWTMAHGGFSDWLLPNIAGLPAPEEGPLAFWLGALCIKLFGWLVGDVLAARMSTIGIFVLGTVSLWQTAFRLGRRAEAQPLRLAFGGQPEPDDYGRTLADTAVLIYLGCLGLLLQSHETLAVTLQGSLLAWFLYHAQRGADRRGAGRTGADPRHRLAHRDAGRPVPVHPLPQDAGAPGAAPPRPGRRRRRAGDAGLDSAGTAGEALQPGAGE